MKVALYYLPQPRALTSRVSVVYISRLFSCLCRAKGSANALDPIWQTAILPGIFPNRILPAIFSTFKKTKALCPSG